MNTHTVVVNGLPVEFSEIVPTRVGDYYAIDSCINTTKATIDDVAILRVKERYGVYVLGQLRHFHYLWSTYPLIPACEIIKAHAEGYASAGTGSFPEGQFNWSNSRARKIVNGEPVT